MNAKAPAIAPPVPFRAHDRSTGADYDGLRLWRVPCVGQLLTITRGRKRRTFRVEDVQHIAAAEDPKLQLYLRKAQPPIRHREHGKTH